VAESGNADDGAVPELLGRAGRGDREAFAEVYRRFSPRVFGLCLHLLGSRPDAEDATSEVFLKVRAAVDRYDRSVPFGAWATSIATNHCIDRLRRRSREARLFDPELPEDTPAAGCSPLEEMMAEEARGALLRALAALPDRYRVPLVLRYHAELTYADIASQLGLAREAVAVNLFRAKQRLRRELMRPAEEIP
jgi:RNA polymerase sigma-70 factor (ECF subfamily)